MLKDKFGNKVKELRITKSMSQEELAVLMDIDRAQISKIEKGKINVTLDTIEKIANALNVSIAELMTFEADSCSPHPFVKWAGGKTQILSKLKEYMPSEFNRYYEPFVGGGALLFSLMPKHACINDSNTELMCAFECFNDEKSIKMLKDELRKHEANHSEEYYYIVRKMDQEPGFKDKPNYVRAARMIYLNKSCFNGLYRVNGKGYFNVPFGKKTKVNTFEPENFTAIRNYFINNDIEIDNKDFTETVSTAKKGDFVYFDPPYDVYPDKLGFVSYEKGGFGKEEQARLRDCFKALSDKGVKVMLSNHNTPYINELYQGFNIHVIEAKRMINSKGDGRGAVEEVIITNY